MRPLIGEIVHAAKRSPLPIATVLMVAAGFLSPAIPITEGHSAGGVTLATSYNYSDRYNFVVVAFDGTGQTIAGTTITATFTYSNQSGTPIAAESGVTNSRGLLDFAWNHTACRCSIELATGASSLTAPILESSNMWTPLGGALYVVPAGLILGRPAILVAYSSAEGEVPPGTVLSYCAPANNQSVLCQSHLIGNVTENPELFSLATMPVYPNAYDVNITLSAYDGRVNQTYPATFADLNQTSPASVGLTPTGMIIKNSVTLLPLFAALGGVLIGYGVYIQERSEGSLEPVLALPVTRSQVVIRRFSVGLLWVALSGGLATTASIVVTERVAAVSLPFTVSFGIFLLILGVGATFLGLSFLGGTLARSSAPVLAVLLVLASTLTILWDAVIASAASIGQWVNTVGPNPAQAGGALGLSVVNVAAGEPPAAFTPQVDPLIGGVLLVAWVGVAFVGAWLNFVFRD